MEEDRYAIGTTHLFYGQEATVVGQGITYDDKYAPPQQPVLVLFIECPAILPGVVKLRGNEVLALSDWQGRF